MAQLYDSSATDSSDKENPDDDKQPTQIRRSARLASQSGLRKTVVYDSTDQDAEDIDEFQCQHPKKLTVPRKNKSTKERATGRKRKRSKITPPETLLDESSDSELVHIPEDDEVVQRKRKTAPRKKKSTTETEGTKRKRTKLNKDERSKITRSIEGMGISDALKQVEASFKEEVKNRDLGLTDIISDFLEKKDLLRSLIECHRATFVDLYNKCSKIKEKYLRFQLDWHTHCSVFLLPKGSTVQCILPNLRDDEKICTTRSLWQEFCDLYPSESLEKCKKVMILFSSAMYNILSEQVLCQQAAYSSRCTVTDPSPSNDGDDVYYRFGGAAIADMLKVRYTKRSSTSATSNVSHEIKILQSINTKEKSNMPEYLKYRDRGYMYTPHPIFIPFFRDVDNCIREVVNPTGFQEQTHELVKVHCV